MRYAMIMAGGAGTRLWPLSRRDRPKQLLRFIHRNGSPPKSLLELAAQRLEGLVEPDHRLICTGEEYRKAVLEALPQFEDRHLLGEPVGRDTLNAVGLAAVVLEKRDPDAIFAVLTADHIIEPEDTFRERMALGFRLVEQDPTRLVTFSIKPTYPATGYGYCERGAPINGVEGAARDGEPLAYRVVRFIEKPDLYRAQVYVESGMFGWNSGMFVFHAGTILKCLERFKPEACAGLRRIQEAWGTPRQAEVLREVYPSQPKISVDYAIMEPASRDREVAICTVQMDVTWLDVGSWPSYAQTLTPDVSGNRVSGDGIIANSRDSLIVNEVPGHTVAVLGGDGVIVVHTADATLVVPASRAQEIKDLQARLAERLR